VFGGYIGTGVATHANISSKQRLRGNYEFNTTGYQNIKIILDFF
jgi:hypothetical protein